MTKLLCKRCQTKVTPIVNENFRRSDGKTATKATCPICDSFIQFLARNDRTDFTFHFGKYNGTKLSELKDNNYLEYIKGYNVLKQWQIDLINKQIAKNNQR